MTAVVTGPQEIAALQPKLVVDGIRVWGNVELARTRVINMLLELEQAGPVRPTDRMATRFEEHSAGIQRWRTQTAERIATTDS